MAKNANKSKKKKRDLSSKVQNRTKTSDSKPNPFEVKMSRQKHTILNKKSKHNKGMPAVSRSKGLQKRSATLLLEYKQRHKSNKFLDRRLGENDPEMSVEDKMMERFALEKQRTHEKSSIYSLSADDDLTHYGQSLSSLEKFEEPQLESDDEDDRGLIDKKFVAEEHFGGGFLTKKGKEDGKSKSRQEIFEEIIAKSKKEKFNRQNEKEDVLQMTEQLDQDFRDVTQLLAKVKRNKAEERMKPDDYDVSVRELLYDIRAKASDRMKTPEELAKDERERLDGLEADRQRRMKGITPEEEEETKRRANYMSADDLNDGFELHTDKRSTLSYNDGVPSYGIGGGDDEEKDEEEEEEGEEDEEEDEEESGDDGEEDEEEEEEEEEEEDNASDLDSEHSESDDEDEDEVEDDDDNDGDEKKTGKQLKSSLKQAGRQTPPKNVKIKEAAEILKKREDIIKRAKEEIPYTFKAPENLEEFEELVCNYAASDQLIIIERLRKCHHPSLAEGNKAKLETLTTLLYDYLGKCVTEGEVVDVDFVNGLTKHLFELTQTCALVSGNYLQGIISDRFDKFNQEMEEKGRPSFPAIDVLLYFKLVCVLFPTSDFRHSVVTPTMLFMGAAVSQCQVRSQRDVASGLFICNLFLKFVSLSKRFVPEAINFLRGILFMGSDHETKTGGLVVAPFRHTGRYAKLLRYEGTRHCTLEPPSALPLLLDPGAAPVDPASFSTWAVALSIHLLQQFSSLYVELPSYKEVFDPVSRLLASREKLLDHYPDEIKKLGEDLVSHIETNQHRQRRVLEVEKKKPAPLKMFEPKIEDNYDPSRKNRSTGNKDHDERQRLVHRHRREMKGAIREVRKDSQFIARQKLKDQKELDDERKEKVKRIHQMLATQEGDVRDFKRKKQKI